MGEIHQLHQDQNLIQHMQVTTEIIKLKQLLYVIKYDFNNVLY